jgi:hypothetical protein
MSETALPLPKKALAGLRAEPPYLPLSAFKGWRALRADLHRRKEADFSDANPLLFYHIVKTAGSSFLHSFRLAYPNSYYDSFAPRTPEGLFERFHAFAALDRAQRRSQRFIHIHVPAPLHQHIPGRSSYATMLRDPVKQVLSFYFWQKEVRRQGNEDWVRYAPDIPLEDLPLPDFLDQYEAIWSNMCCKQIGNILRIEETPEALLHRITELPDEMLYERARQVIERHFSFVGLAERFSESLVALNILRGHRRVYLWTPMQASHRPEIETIDPAIIARIEAGMRADRQLHDWALARFDRAYGLVGAFLKRHGIEDLSVSLREKNGVSSDAPISGVEVEAMVTRHFIERFYWKILRYLKA